MERLDWIIALIVISMGLANGVGSNSGGPEASGTNVERVEQAR